MSIKVAPRTLPPAGVDTIDITIEETYQIDGIGEDRITLQGKLVAERTAPLLGDEDIESWETSTVVSRFTKLELYGESKVFGPVIATLDDSVPSFGVVKAGKCAAAIPLQIAMPKHNLTLKSEEPVQLRSDVETVPPIGDEKTESVRSVKLLNTRTLRPMGTLISAKVAWRELTEQTVALEKDRITDGLTDTTSDKTLDERFSDLTRKLNSLLQEVAAIKSEVQK